MKKKLQEDLLSIAHKVLKMKDSAEASQLADEARQLYEKLTILSFTESHFAEMQPTIGKITSILDTETTVETSAALKPDVISGPSTTLLEPTSEKQPDTKANSDPEPKLLEDKEPNLFVQEEVKETRPEHIIERINERVSEDLFVPATTKNEVTIQFSESSYVKNDKEGIEEPVQNMPIAPHKNEDRDKPRSLNDQLKRGIHIGLNNRIAFIKHLFNGSSDDYNRVLSQLNTLNSKKEAEQFVQNMVKSDYNNWSGKEEYEERFMEIIANKFED